MTPPRMHVLALLAAAGLGACATQGPDPRAWRVQPVYRIQHAQAQFDGHYATGRYLEGQQRWAAAEQAYRRALELQPTHVEAHNRLALVLAEQGRLTAAIAALEQALVLDPQAAHLLNNLGYLQWRAGRREAAAATLHRALALDPHSVTARRNLEAVLSVIAGPAVPQAPARQADAAAVPPGGTGALQAETRAVTAGAVHTLPLTPAPLPLPLSTAAPAPLVLQSPTVPALPLQVGEPSGARHAAEPAPAVAAPSPPPVSRPAARIELSNGNGVGGFASRVRGWLAWLGVKVDRLTNHRPYREANTLVQYREGYEAQARELARQLPLPALVEARNDLDPRADVRVVLGHDFRAQAACLDTRRCTPPALAATSGKTLPQ